MYLFIILTFAFLGSAWCDIPTTAAYSSITAPIGVVGRKFVEFPPNGRFYTCPTSDNLVRTYNPLDGTYSMLADISVTYGSSQCSAGNSPCWGAAIYSEAAKVIFCIPATHKDLLIIDPYSVQTVRYYPSTLDPVAPTGSAKWLDCTTFQSKAYCAPAINYASALVLDLSKRTAFLPKLVATGITPTGSQQFGIGAAAQNGAVYFPPQGISSVLKISGTTATLFATGVGIAYSAFLLANFKLWTVAIQGGKVMIFDPVTDTLNSNHPHFSTLGSRGWSALAIGTNGRLYGCPTATAATGAGQVLELDPYGYTFRVFGLVVPVQASPAFGDAVSVPNGHFICTPGAYGRVLAINTARHSTELLQGTFVGGSFCATSSISGRTLCMVTSTTAFIWINGNAPHPINRKFVYHRPTIDEIDQCRSLGGLYMTCNSEAVCCSPYTTCTCEKRARPSSWNNW